MVLSSMSPAELCDSISTGNERLIKSVKGIGLKTAQRIIVDLRDKIVALGITDEIPVGGMMAAPVNNKVKDEAVSALDASVQAEVLRLLKGLRGQMAQIFITHDIQAAALLCDRLAVLHQGRLTDDRALTELHAASPRLRHLLDASLRLELPARPHASPLPTQEEQP